MKASIRKTSFSTKTNAPTLRTSLVRKIGIDELDENIPTINSYHELVKYVRTIWLVSIPKSGVDTNHAKDYFNGIVVGLNCQTEFEDYQNVYYLNNNQSWLHQGKMLNKKMCIKDGFILFMSEKDLEKINEKCYVTNLYGRRTAKDIFNHPVVGILPPPIILDSEVFTFIRDQISEFYTPITPLSSSDCRTIIISKEKIADDSEGLCNIMPIGLTNMIDDMSAERRRIYEEKYDIILKMVYANIDILLMAEEDIKKEIVDYLLPTLPFNIYTPTPIDLMHDDGDDIFEDQNLIRYTRVDVPTHKNGCLLYAVNYLTKKFSGSSDDIYTQMKELMMSKVDSIEYDIMVLKNVIDVKTHVSNIFRNNDMLDDICIMLLSLMFDITIYIWTRDAIIKFNTAPNCINIYHEDSHFEPLEESSDGNFFFDTDAILSAKEVYAVSSRPKIIEVSDGDSVEKKKEINGNDTHCNDRNALAPINVVTTKDQLSEERTTEIQSLKYNVDTTCATCGNFIGGIQNKDVNDKQTIEVMNEKISMLLQSVTQLTTKLESVESQNGLLQTKVESLTTKVEQLEQANTLLKNELVELKQENILLKQENVELHKVSECERQNNAKLTQENSLLLSENLRIKNENEILHKRIIELENELSMVRTQKKKLKNTSKQLTESACQTNIGKYSSTETQTIEVIGNNDISPLNDKVPLVAEQTADLSNPETIKSEHIERPEYNETAQQCKLPSVVSNVCSGQANTTHQPIVSRNVPLTLELTKYIGSVYKSLYRNNNSESNLVIERSVEDMIRMVENNIHSILHYNVMTHLVPSINTHYIIDPPS